MGIMVGSARISERGTINGAKGDSTGKEVATEPFYVHQLGWNVIRAKEDKVANDLALAMSCACFNNNYGYGQSDRLSSYNESAKINFATAYLNKPVNTDCSELVRICLGFAGIHVNDFNTSNELGVITATGRFDSFPYTNNTVLCNGDILVTKSKGHTVIVTSGAVERGTVKPKASIEYLVLIKGRWLPIVTNNNDYAGIENAPILGFACHMTDNSPIRYRAHANGKWFPWVTGWNIYDSNNGWAGDGVHSIDAIEIKCDAYDIRYKVSTTSSTSYYSEVLDATVSGGESYAGAFGKPIDKVMCRVN